MAAIRSRRTTPIVLVAAACAILALGGCGESPDAGTVHLSDAPQAAESKGVAPAPGAPGKGKKGPLPSLGTNRSGPSGRRLR